MCVHILFALEKIIYRNVGYSLILLFLVHHYYQYLSYNYIVLLREDPEYERPAGRGQAFERLIIISGTESPIDKRSSLVGTPHSFYRVWDQCRIVPVPTHGSLETFGGPQRHAIAHLKAGKMVIPNMSSVMLGKSVLF